MKNLFNNANKEKEAHKFGDAVSFYKEYRDYVKHEDNLINNRLTWILTIHGFLYATYGITLQKQLDVASNFYIHKPNCSEEIYMTLARLLRQSEYFLFGISAVGFCISIAGLLSIIAAQSAVGSVLRIYGKYTNGIVENIEDTDGDGFQKKSVALISRLDNGVCLPWLTGGGKISNQSFGHFAPLCIPIILATTWFVSFYFLFDVYSKNASIYCG